MILYIASAVLFSFIAVNLFYRSPCSPFIKLVGTAILLLISLKYEIYQFLGGYFFAPQLPRSVLLVLEALYGAFLCLFFLLLLWDIYLLGNWLLGKMGFPVPHNLPKGFIKCGLCILALGLGVWGTYQSVKVPDVHRLQIAINGLPKGLEGTTLVQLTDIHIGPLLKKEWLAEVVEKVNALAPDLILLTGDYVDGYAEEIGEELEPLAHLKARYGVLAVTGNHEYYWNMPTWKKVLTNLNVELLENTHRSFPINGSTLVVAGVPDLAAEKFGMEGPDLGKSLRNAPEGIKILLSHQPKNGHAYAGQIDLMLSGHTHGGLMFFLQPLVARFNSGFVYGIYPTSASNIYVSPGTGLWNGLSCRLGVPPEITLITLIRGEAKK